MKMKNYSISDVSQICDISASALRYYEDEGLILDIKRIGNRRVYSEIDIEKIRYIKCFRELGMSIHDIKRELQNRQLDNIGIKEILVDHLQFLKDREKDIKKNISIIERKLNEY